MYTVTMRAKSVKQPRGGFLPLSDFDIDERDDGIRLNTNENVHPIIIGTVVEYLAKLQTGFPLLEAFDASFRGAGIAGDKGVIKDVAKTLTPIITGIKGTDDASIINACKLTTFDEWYRNPGYTGSAYTYKDVNPDKATIENIKTMVDRSMSFFLDYGKPEYQGFTFNPPRIDRKARDKMEAGGLPYGGYTYTVSDGDGDFLTADGMWDFKVLRSEPTSKHTLQLLMYWIMGQHSGQDKYKPIKTIGFFNPRQNKVYKLDVDRIPAWIIETVENEVICY